MCVCVCVSRGKIPTPWSSPIHAWKENDQRGWNSYSPHELSTLKWVMYPPVMTATPWSTAHFLAAWEFLNTASLGAATLPAWTPALAEWQAYHTSKWAHSFILHQFTTHNCINEWEFTGVWLTKGNSDIDVETILSKC